MLMFSPVGRSLTFVAPWSEAAANRSLGWYSPMTTPLRTPNSIFLAFKPYINLKFRLLSQQKKKQKQIFVLTSKIMAPWPRPALTEPNSMFSRPAPPSMR